MVVGTQSRCNHVYLHVDRKSHLTGHSKGMVPIWRCSLKKKDLEGICEGLTKAGIETTCHRNECPLAAYHMPWEQCPFFEPKI
jgi:hypothetical protein